MHILVLKWLLKKNKIIFLFELKLIMSTVLDIFYNLQFEKITFYILLLL